MLPIWRSQDPMSATHVSLGLELMQAAKKLNPGGDIIAIATQLRPLPMPPLQRRYQLGIVAEYRRCGLVPSQGRWARPHHGIA